MILVLIPARGGSKGIPKKNIKLMNGKPLINYTIEAARKCFSDDDICVSTDSDEIIDIVENTGLKVPFKRPDVLASDSATSESIIHHAIEFYQAKGVFVNHVMLLQPTSPLRNEHHIKAALDQYLNCDKAVEMLVSVKITDANPYYFLAEEDDAGYLVKSKISNATRRQDVPTVYEYNGAIYIYNVAALKNKSIKDFTKVVKFEMDATSSVDIDTPLDWKWAEYLLRTTKNE
ncbi:acylneuraminate cytidylyltransferase family protein [Nonlabens tegetincola]|uniref:acylneuraminate cytidylyltransferase family protein n=1 Tax=Nonlabens tegetincola TaxID=323273 RepID=UPI0030C850A2